MKRLLISYDLKRPGQNYDDLIDYLETYIHAKPLLSVWLIATTKSPEAVRDEILAGGFIDKNDKLIIVDTTNKDAAWHPGGIEWLRSSQLKKLG